MSKHGSLQKEIKAISNERMWNFWEVFRERRQGRIVNKIVREETGIQNVLK
jgi:hypothetical protein